MGPNLLNNYGQVIAMLMFVIGFANLLFHKNMIKKIIGFNIMDSSIYLFLAQMGYIKSHIVPIATDGAASVDQYINPIPTGLVLTGIVVSVSVTALMLSLCVRLYRRYNTLDLDEITTMLRKEGR
ncbi:MAG: cation:proton antiporter subunit C [Lachnospiraceae bacterium]|nr:cation:proton antiporter subunit C [Lachnospiraceae bacterium]